MSKDHGPALYRRGLYTFWKRQAPPPLLLAFDAPTREIRQCRSRTNTPMQALVVLNDPTYVEAARKLAERVLQGGGATDDECLRRVFLIVASRQPDADEQSQLAKLLGATNRGRSEGTLSRGGRCWRSASRLPTRRSIRLDWRPGRLWPMRS